MKIFANVSLVRRDMGYLKMAFLRAEKTERVAATRVFMSGVIDRTEESWVPNAYENQHISYQL